MCIIAFEESEVEMDLSSKFDEIKKSLIAEKPTKKKD